MIFDGDVSNPFHLAHLYLWSWVDTHGLCIPVGAGTRAISRAAGRGESVEYLDTFLCWSRTSLFGYEWLGLGGHLVYFIAARTVHPCLYSSGREVGVSRFSSWIFAMQAFRISCLCLFRTSYRDCEQMDEAFATSSRSIFIPPLFHSCLRDITPFCNHESLLLPACSGGYTAGKIRLGTMKAYMFELFADKDHVGKLEVWRKWAICLPQ